MMNESLIITKNSSSTGIRIRNGWDLSDERFDKLYSQHSQLLAHRHWTPLGVAKAAAQFLAVESNAKILDIGSGVGKFCLAASLFEPRVTFYGVEQRKELLIEAEKVKEILQVRNVHFIGGNFTQIDFDKYDHFYFFNSFYENISGTSKIDNNIDYSIELYNYYNRYLYNQLKQKPAGTRVASFHSLEDEMPPGYHVVGTDINQLLKFWIKI